jgi:hypothetical protein
VISSCSSKKIAAIQIKALGPEVRPVERERTNEASKQDAETKAAESGAKQEEDRKAARAMAEDSYD